MNRADSQDVQCGQVDAQPRSSQAHGMDRRSFLQGSAGAVALPFVARRSPLGANDTLRVGVVGFRSRGNAHIRGFDRLDGVRVTALCDVDAKVLERGANALAKRRAKKRGKPDAGDRVATYADIRKMLDDDVVDIVALATPNHVHALHAIWAIQAGKDVYVEKPVSHNVWEGRQIVNAARKHGRIVQTGTQSRSNPGLRQLIAWVQGGGLGKIQLARGLCYKPRGSLGKSSKALAVPEHIDFDLWCGPAPKGPIMRRQLHYDWHWVWPTGNGDLGNQGIHQMDMCRWVLGYDKLCNKVTSFGGRLGYDDDGTTPNTLVTHFDFGGVPLIFEVRGLRSRKAAAAVKGKKRKTPPMDRYKGVGIGCVFHCEGGWVSVTSYGGGAAFDHDGVKIKQWRKGGDHFANFIEAVRSRKSDDLHADILEGHLSSALCHLGNISYLRGKHASLDELRASCAQDEWMQEVHGRFAKHLERNAVDIAKTPIRVGPSLAFDPGSERFVGDERANAMLTRDYRAPYVVPEIS